MIKFGNTYLKYNGNYFCGFKVPTYNVILQQNEGGIIGATPLTGNRNTEVTLSNTPYQNYTFNGYEISGSTLYDTNKFKFVDCDVTAMAKWNYEWPDPNPLNLPPNTVRVRTSDGNPPNINAYDVSATLVEGTTDVYDVYKSGNLFYKLLYESYNLIEVLGANTTNVTDMEYMFAGCMNLSSVAYFDTSNVKYMNNMFNICISLKNIPEYNTENVVNMGNMFRDCESLESVPCFNTQNVTAMNGMLSYCYSLTSIPAFDTSNVTNMCEFASNSYNVVYVPLLNTTNVTDMHYMFASCSSLSSIPLFDTSKVTNMQYAFGYCFSVQTGALALYQQASTQATPPTYYYRAFEMCGYLTQTGSAELAQIPNGWK